MHPKLSVLDLIPVRSDQSSGDALAATIELARAADRLGYERYWIAEHHNMPPVGATNPPVVIALIGAATARIRVGSGGVMLPNHRPLAIAEQFALLEAAFPGRVDLGLGRAPGSDAVTNWALRMPTDPHEDPAAEFPRDVANVIAMMGRDGFSIQLRTSRYQVRATPQASGEPVVWLLGSSDFSAQLAAQMGLPYVFAHHFSGQGTAAALALYRQQFQPSAALAAPRTFLTINAIVADTRAEAERLSLPQRQMMLQLRTNTPLSRLPLVEEAEQRQLTVQQQRLYDESAAGWVIGSPDEAAAEVKALAAEFDVDEVMVSPVAAATVGTAAQSAPARVRTLELLAAALT